MWLLIVFNVIKRCLSVSCPINVCADLFIELSFLAIIFFSLLIAVALFNSIRNRKFKWFYCEPGAKRNQIEMFHSYFLFYFIDHLTAIKFFFSSQCDLKAHFGKTSVWFTFCSFVRWKQKKNIMQLPFFTSMKYKRKSKVYFPLTSRLSSSSSHCLRWHFQINFPISCNIWWYFNLLCYFSYFNHHLSRWYCSLHFHWCKVQSQKKKNV